MSGQVNFIEGHAGRIVCEGHGKPTPNIYNWNKENELVINEATLTFDSIQKTDSGEYSCEIQNNMNSTDGKQMMGTNTSSVNVVILCKYSLKL